MTPQDAEREMEPLQYVFGREGCNQIKIPELCMDSCHENYKSVVCLTTFSYWNHNLW